MIVTTVCAGVIKNAEPFDFVHEVLAARFPARQSFSANSLLLGPTYCGISQYQLATPSDVRDAGGRHLQFVSRAQVGAYDHR